MRAANTATKIKGLAAILLASVLFGLTYSTAKIVQAEGMSESGNGFWCGLMSLCFVLVYSLVRRKNPFKLASKKQILLCAVVGSVGIWLSGYMFMIAYRYLSVSATTMLHFLHPVMIAIFMSIAYKQRFTLATLGATVLSIGGMFLITGEIVASSALGIIAAVLSGVFYAVYAVLFEKSDLANLDAGAAMVYIYLASSLSSAVASILMGEFMLPVTGVVWATDLVMSATGLAAYLLTVYAIRCLGATGASFGCMLEPITSCLLAVVIFKETLTANLIWGSVLVVLSVVCITLNDLPAKNTGKIAGHTDPETID